MIDHSADRIEREEHARTIGHCAWCSEDVLDGEEYEPGDDGEGVMHTNCNREAHPAPEKRPNVTYRVVRHYQRDYRSRIVARHLTLEEAQAHCSDLNTSSSTAWTTSALKRTRRYGPWFDGYEEEK